MPEVIRKGSSTGSPPSDNFNWKMSRVPPRSRFETKKRDLESGPQIGLRFALSLSVTSRGCPPLAATIAMALGAILPTPNGGGANVKDGLPETNAIHFESGDQDGACGSNASAIFSEVMLSKVLTQISLPRT